MPVELVYILIGLFIFAVNAMPAFIPPTWMILAFFYLNWDLQLLPLVVIGACSATSGRLVLGLISRYFSFKILPEKWLINYRNLGLFFKTYEELTIPVVIAYAFSPIPSNQIFIIAGLANLNLKLISASFLIGRLISYTFWVTLASQVVDNLENLFTSHLTNLNTLLIEVLSFALIFLIGKINWSEILKNNPKSFKLPDD